MTRKKLASLKFGEAREELEKILREIEENEVDVDDLAERVRTAAELIKICRDKLERTKVEVEKVVAELLPRETKVENGGDRGGDRSGGGLPSPEGGQETGSGEAGEAPF